MSKQMEQQRLLDSVASSIQKVSLLAHQATGSLAVLRECPASTETMENIVGLMDAIQREAKQIEQGTRIMRTIEIVWPNAQ